MQIVHLQAAVMSVICMIAIHHDERGKTWWSPAADMGGHCISLNAWLSARKHLSKVSLYMGPFGTIFFSNSVLFPHKYCFNILEFCLFTFYANFTIGELPQRTIFLVIYTGFRP